MSVTHLIAPPAVRSRRELCGSARGADIEFCWHQTFQDGDDPSIWREPGTVTALFETAPKVLDVYPDDAAATIINGMGDPTTTTGRKVLVL